MYSLIESLRENFPNTKFFLVHIFPHFDGGLQFSRSELRNLY